MHRTLGWITLWGILFVGFSLRTSAQEANSASIVWIEYPTSVIALRHDPAQMNCNAKIENPEGRDLPPLNLKWFHNGEPLRTTSEHTISLGVLFFVSVHLRDQGVYWCEASVSNTSLWSRSENATLEIAYLRESFREVPKTTIATRGGISILDCDPPEGRPVPTVEWLKEGMAVKVGKAPNSRIQLRGSGSLIIKDVRASDEGAYVCKAENMVGIRESPAITLRIKSTSKPRFQNIPKNQTVRFSTKNPASVRFKCSATGDPMPRIRWFKDSRIMRSSGGHLQNLDGEGERFALVTQEDHRRSIFSVLEIGHVQPEDHGVYMCEAENANGRVTTQAALNVKYGPTWIVPPEDQQLRLWAPLTLRCEAAGFPRPTIYWRQGSGSRRFLPNSSDDRINVDIHGTLTISAILPQDQGTYSCTAESSNGEITAASTVAVVGSPPGTLHAESPLHGVFSSPWLLVSLSASLCLFLICAAVSILVLLRKMHRKAQTSITQVPVAKGTTFNFFPDPSHLPTPIPVYLNSTMSEKVLLYETPLNFVNAGGPMDMAHRPSFRSEMTSPQSPKLGPYTSTTLVATGNGHFSQFEHRPECDAFSRPTGYPVAMGVQGAHEFENILHSGYSTSLPSGSSSVEKRSGRSSRSSSSRPRVPTSPPSSREGDHPAVQVEPIYNSVGEVSNGDDNEYHEINFCEPMTEL